MQNWQCESGNYADKYPVRVDDVQIEILLQDLNDVEQERCEISLSQSAVDPW